MPGCRPDPLGDDVPKPLFVLLSKRVFFKPRAAPQIPMAELSALRAAEHITQGLAGLGGRATQRRLGGGASKNANLSLYPEACRVKQSSCNTL